MDQKQPLVTIGIPTFNRANYLQRAIDAALGQDYSNIEVVVSDNASTDETERLCRSYCGRDVRIKYLRQPRNVGPTKNFSEVLKSASGEFFMWLGDDDWIDREYVSLCVKELCADPELVLVSGAPRYYQNGQRTYSGKTFNLLHGSPWRRVVSYYAKVSDNGMFYGLMRTVKVNQLELRNTMGGDWLLMADMAFAGKTRMLPTISVHRELGGATVSYRKITQSLGLPRIQAVFPRLSIATNACLSVAVRKNTVFYAKPRLTRIAAATVIFVVMGLRIVTDRLGAVRRRLNRIFSAARQ